MRSKLNAVRVLIVEDQVKMASLLRRALRGAGVAADVAIKGEDALWMAGATSYGALVLDIMLPGIDGFETCRRLRSDQVWTPVLMLTARDALRDRVAGLDGGARRLPDQALRPRGTARAAGPGFTPLFLPRAFERFARADASRTTPGTGLGLATLHAIAKAHGGSAHAANLVGGGADVWIAILSDARPLGLPTRRPSTSG